MTLGDIYELFIREGIQTDPRRPADIKRKLTDSHREYQKQERWQKKFFDKERFRNPYADTRILFGDPACEIRRILVGIDIEVGELLLAERMSQKGNPVDMVLAHHPEGLALAGLDDVMDLQTNVLADRGIRKDIACDLMDKRRKEVARRLHSANHTRAVDAAKLLKLPFMCCHTPSDNHAVRYLEKRIARERPRRLKNLIQLLLHEPEYAEAATHQAGPWLLIGKPDDRVGEVFVDMTGGTEGSKEVFARLSQVGIDTQLSMHLSEEHFNKIKDEHIKVVIAGHMPSDNLGMNLLLDKLEKKGKIEIIACSGFRRIKRSWG